MPKFVVAHKSGAHRLAAIALYRALLSQCNKLDIPAQRRYELNNVVRCRFAGFRHTTSHRQLKLLFEAGYEAIDHLDAAVAGDADSKQYVLDLLQRAPKNVKNGPLITRRSISEEYNEPFDYKSESTETDNAAVVEDAASTGTRCEVVLVKRNSDTGRITEGLSQGDVIRPPISKYVFDSTTLRDTDSPPKFQYRPADAATIPPSPPSVLEHATPREWLGGSGQRHIPKVFSANAIPVLRMKKPQPLALTRYLNSRIKQRQKRHDLRHHLQEQEGIAAQEDEWDDILLAYAGISDAGSHAISRSRTSPQEPRWGSEVSRSVREVNAYLNEEKAKNRLMAEKMYAVVDREESLAEQERQEDKRRRNEIAEGLAGLSGMVGGSGSADDTFSRSTS
ncbi:hypothetical protein CB0940_00733 [Cercospora beticola]|uniref:Uncharacterized protein n=1 Tax=Cercospora beticola TaxID=122368 RepID=A0A2G5I9X2_CERBT|nr:hypothetical protein CB0940_00733 [Cercospora beticola]PIB01588.1 hypothetical protein CB0940_00733 [Cercospora beticola]WPA96161.1 hypothetical protein RHO25_000767 [Cercospora beticola]